MAAEAGTPVFRVSIIAIMLFQICALFVRSTLDLSLIRHGSARPVANDLSYLVVPPILIVLLYPYLRQNRDALANLFRPARLTLRLCCLSLLLGLTMRVTYWALLTVLMWAGVIANDDPLAIVGPFFAFGCPPLLELALSLFVMAFLVPVVEEVVNRGMLLHSLLRRGAVTSIFGSACLFAVMHHPAAYVIALITGLFLGTQVLNSRSLWAPLLTHAAYNAAAVFHWDCFQIIWNPSRADPALASAARIAAPVAVGGILLCCWLVSKKAIGTSRPDCPRSALRTRSPPVQ